MNSKKTLIYQAKKNRFGGWVSIVDDTNGKGTAKELLDASSLQKKTRVLCGGVIDD